MLILTGLGVSAALASRFAEEIVLKRATDIEVDSVEPSEEGNRIEIQYSARIYVGDNDVRVVVSPDVITEMPQNLAGAPSPDPQAYIHVDIDQIVFEIHGKVLGLLAKQIQGEDAGDEFHQLHEYPEQCALQIRSMGKIAGLTEAFAEDLIKRKITVQDAQEIILKQMLASNSERHD